MSEKGAMAYLKQQYKVVTMVFVVLAIVFAFMAYVLEVPEPVGSVCIPYGRSFSPDWQASSA